MPKLLPAKAAEVRKAGEASGTSGKFVLLPEGKWKVKLVDVESKTSSKGDPMWVWSYKAVEFLEGDGVPKNDKGETIDFSDRELKYYTVIKDTTLWDLDRVFGAFDADADTDTDELIGDEIIVAVDQQIITGGKSKGQMGNNVTDFFTLDGGLKHDDRAELIPAGAASEDPGF